MLRTTVFFIMLIFFATAMEVVIGYHIGSVFMPDMFLMIVLYSTWRYGLITGELTGFFVGSVHDTLGIGLFGTNMLIYTCIGYVLGITVKRIDRDNIFILIVVGFVCSILHKIIFYGIQQMAPLPLVIEYSWGYILKPFVNAVWIPVVFWFFQRLGKKWFRIDISDGTYI